MALGYDVGIDETGGGGSLVRVDRTMPAEVPDFVKKLVGETLDVRQTEEWSAPDGDGRRTADIRIEVVGQPARMTGVIVLEPTAEGCREVVTGQVKVSIPFLGGKIEPEIAKAIRRAMRVEEKTGREWLAKRSMGRSRQLVPRASRLCPTGSGNVVGMAQPDVLLMLSGVSRPCPDCVDDRVFVPADDAEEPGAYCCTVCGAAVLVDIDAEIADTGAARVA